MGTVYTFGTLINMCRSSFARAITDDLGPEVCNLANYEIWNAFDWRESLAEFPRFCLTPAIQDYGPPVVAVPTDYFGLRSAFYIDLSSGGNAAYRYPLSTMSQLPSTAREGPPTSISYNEATRSFRLYPRFTGGSGTPWYVCGGIYKKDVPTVITGQNMGSTYIPLKDHYLRAYVEMMIWAAMTLNAEPQSGQTQVQNGVTSHTGQFAKAMAALTMAARKEGVERGSAPVHPRRPLAGGYYGGGGYFGLGGW